MSTDLCKSTVYHRLSSNWGESRPCKHKAVLDGYCKIHNPEERAKRRKARGQLFSSVRSLPTGRSASGMSSSRLDLGGLSEPSRSLLA